MAQDEQESRTQSACDSDPEEDTSFERLKALQQTIASLNEQLELGAHLGADLNRDLGKERSKVHGLRDQLDDLQNSFDRERAKLMEDHEKLQVQIGMQNSELEGCKERKAHNLAEIKRLSDRIGGLEAEIEDMRNIVPPSGEEEPRRRESELKNLRALVATKTRTIENGEEERKQLNLRIEKLSCRVDKDSLTISQLEETVASQQAHANKIISETEQKSTDLRAQLKSSEKHSERLRQEAEKRCNEAEKRCNEAEKKCSQAEKRYSEAEGKITEAEKQRVETDYRRAAADVKAAEAAQVEVERDTARLDKSDEAKFLDLERRNLPEPGYLQLTEFLNKNSKIVIQECYYPEEKVLQIACCLIKTSVRNEWQYCTPDEKKLTPSMYGKDGTLAQAWMEEKHLIRWRAGDRECFDMWCRRSHSLPQRSRKRDYTMFGTSDTPKLKKVQQKRGREGGVVADPLHLRQNTDEELDTEATGTATMIKRIRIDRQSK
jgi:chromosome segregation ATPase